MKRWQKIALALFAGAVAVIALVERLSATSPSTLDDEIDVIAGRLPKYEEARGKDFEGIYDSLEYNHLASLGREGARRIFERIRSAKDPENEIPLLANAFAFYEYKQEYIDNLALLVAQGSPIARIYAVWLLGTIPETSQRPQVLELVKHSASDEDWRVRRAAALTLPRLDWPGADGALAGLMADKDPRVAEIAALSPQFIAHPAQFPDTARALAETVLANSPEPARSYAARSLIEMVRSGAQREPRVLDALRAIADKKEGDTSDAARELLEKPAGSSATRGANEGRP